MERKIALCVSQWSADSTLYAWSYAKQYFLRVRVQGFRFVGVEASALHLPNIYYKIYHGLLLGLSLLSSVVPTKFCQSSRLYHILRCLTPYPTPFWVISQARIILLGVGIGHGLGYSGTFNKTSNRSQE
jgi:hypothetical protein